MWSKFCFDGTGGSPSLREAEQLKADFSKNCIDAANEIKQANILLLVTGAGWSADSGLKVYKDIGNIKAYREQNLSYADLSNPKMIQKDVELFTGFWGQCFNDYRDAKVNYLFLLLF